MPSYEGPMNVKAWAATIAKQFSENKEKNQGYEVAEKIMSSLLSKGESCIPQ